MGRRNKVAVIGAGHVGATVALRVAEKELGDVVLIDVLAGVPAGKALDMQEAAPIEGYDARITGVSDDYEAARDADLVVITAGLPRKPGMSRDDLLSVNMGIMEMVTRRVAAVAPGAVLIIVSNPLDAMCHVAYEASGFPRSRVMGMAGVLDAARFRAFIALALDVSVESVQALVLGGHGDTMVPLPRYTTVGGIPVTALLAPETLEALVDRTRNGGAEIVSLLKTGSAYYAPAFGAVEMAEAVLKDKKKILPCAALLQGEYGIQDLFVGVPVKLGAAGIEQVLEIGLSAEEKAALEHSAASVRGLKEAMARLKPTAVQD